MSHPKAKLAANNITALVFRLMTYLPYNPRKITASRFA
jgi:hypothetical protein